MIRITVKTEDVTPIVCGGGSQAAVSTKSFDIEIPSLEAFLREVKDKKLDYTTRSIVGFEVIEVAQLVSVPTPP